MVFYQWAPNTLIYGMGLLFLVIILGIIRRPKDPIKTDAMDFEIQESPMGAYSTLEFTRDEAKALLRAALDDPEITERTLVAMLDGLLEENLYNGRIVVVKDDTL